MGAFSHLAVWFLDKHETMCLEFCYTSLSRSNAVQLGLATLYGVLVACIFRNMLLATYHILTLVEHDDLMRTYGWLAGWLAEWLAG